MIGRGGASGSGFNGGGYSYGTDWVSSGGGGGAGGAGTRGYFTWWGNVGYGGNGGIGIKSDITGLNTGYGGEVRGQVIRLPVLLLMEVVHLTLVPQLQIAEEEVLHIQMEQVELLL